MEIRQQLKDVISRITSLEEQRSKIYRSPQITYQAQDRLGEIERELATLWDLRHRLDAAKRAGLRQIPVQPSLSPEEQIPDDG